MSNTNSNSFCIKGTWTEASIASARTNIRDADLLVGAVRICEGGEKRDKQGKSFSSSLPCGERYLETTMKADAVFDDASGFSRSMDSSFQSSLTSSSISSTATNKDAQSKDIVDGNRKTADQHSLRRVILLLNRRSKREGPIKTTRKRIRNGRLTSGWKRSMSRFLSVMKGIIFEKQFHNSFTVEGEGQKHEESIKTLVISRGESDQLIKTLNSKTTATAGEDTAELLNFVVEWDAGQFNNLVAHRCTDEESFWECSDSSSSYSDCQNDYFHFKAFDIDDDARKSAFLVGGHYFDAVEVEDSSECEDNEMDDYINEDEPIDKHDCTSGAEPAFECFIVLRNDISDDDVSDISYDDAQDLIGRDNYNGCDSIPCVERSLGSEVSPEEASEVCDLLDDLRLLREKLMYSSE